MTRTPTLWPALLLTLSAHAAFAQSTPSQAPPKLEKIEEVGDDPITVTSKPTPQTKITEKRDNSGNVVETTVKSGPSTYSLRPVHPPGDVTGGTNRGAQWTVLEFDLGKKKKTTKEDDGAPDTTAPPAVK